MTAFRHGERVQDVDDRLPGISEKVKALQITFVSILESVEIVGNRSQIPRLKLKTRVRWGGNNVFGTMRDDARRYIQQNITDRGGFRTNSGYKTGLILASGRGIPRAVHDPGGVCPYARIIRA